MYPEFEQDLAMSIGDEFNPDAINAYQLVDFADENGISNKLLQSHLTKIATSIKNNLQQAISLVDSPSESQVSYLKHYFDIVNTRCDHFLEQANVIPDIEL